MLMGSGVNGSISLPERRICVVRQGGKTHDRRMLSPLSGLLPHIDKDIGPRQLEVPRDDVSNY